MSKKKAKNSNYKNDIGKETESTKEAAISNEQVKRIAAWSALVAAFIGILTALTFCFVPRYTYVEMDFGDFGKIVLKIDEKNAPQTAKNFISLVKKGFYDGLTIFRAQKNFVIQGGKNESITLLPIEGEFESNGHKNKISHKRGVISMARTSDPDSATSQFFITLDDSAAETLDGQYAAFGYVIEGMNVVDDIADCLFDHIIDLYGFVPDKDSIEIVSARVIKNYKENK